MDGCLGTGWVDLTVTGDPKDPRIAWLLFQGKERREAIWPPGFTARFVPKLEVLNPMGQVVLRDGDAVLEGCLLNNDTVTYVSPPF